VEVKPGAERPNVEIHLARSVAKAFSISGIVSGSVKGSGPIQVAYELETGNSTQSGSQAVGNDGRFALRRLQPGFYRVWALSVGGDAPPLQSAASEVKLDGADIANVQLSLLPGIEVTGTLEYAGEEQAKHTEKISVRLMPAGAYGTPAMSEMDAEGSFRIESARPGRYTVHVEPLPENAYIQSAEVDGTEATDEILELKGAPAAKIQIILNRNGAQVSGAVRSKDGQPLRASMATVYLVDDVKRIEKLRHMDPRYVKFASAEGKYTFRAVRPGKYHLVAIDLLEAPDSDEPDFKEMILNAEEIEIPAGGRIVKDLKITPPKEPDEPKKQ
jgi:hypothetical protein